MQRLSDNGNYEMALKMASKIEGHTNKMIIMIRDFLSLARIEESKIQLRPESFELNTLMHEIKEEAELLSNDHQITIVCDQSFVIFADRDKIGQVINNLVSNAIKYSPQGGLITIGCESASGRLKIYVTDQGVGISKADQKRLFERFYRVDNEHVANISGFGIGLFIVAEILKYHDSTIEVESELGKGSTFSFYLPQI